MQGKQNKNKKRNKKINSFCTQINRNAEQIILAVCDANFSRGPSKLTGSVCETAESHNVSYNIYNYYLQNLQGDLCELNNN